MTQMHWTGSGDAEASCVLAASDGFVVAQAHQPDAQKVTGVTLWNGNRDSLVQILLQAGIDAAPVLSVGEVVASPQVLARGLLIERPTTDGDAWTVLGSPLRLMSTPAQVRSAMARLGSEDQEIIRQFHLDVHLRHPAPIESTPHKGTP
jgi:crotonobetainyl-CoA:carnitine CoA-transferase CaiB-like acyl-CoA transferase